MLGSTKLEHNSWGVQPIKYSGPTQTAGQDWVQNPIHQSNEINKSFDKQLIHS